MPNINIKSILISLVIFVFLVNTAYAAGSKLIFTDVDVKVGGKTSKNLEDGETIDDEAEPGDTVEFRIEVKNNFTDEEDLDIEDITLEVTIEEIDDEDDLEEESSEFDLKSERDKKITLKFEVPLEVDEDTFDVLIRAEGDDQNGTDHDAEMRLRLEVEKESHLLKITRKSLSPSEVSCNRKNVQVATTLINIGSEDEEDITFEVLSQDLGVDLSDDIEELTAEPNEDESRFSKVYVFNVPEDAQADSYPVTLRALYDDNRKKSEESLTLTVSDCATKKPEEKPKTAEEEETEPAEEEEEVEVIAPKTPAPITETVIQPPTTGITGAGTVVTQENFFKSNAFIMGIIIAEVVAVIVGIVLVIVLFRRRG